MPIGLAQREQGYDENGNAERDNKRTRDALTLPSPCQLPR